MMTLTEKVAHIKGLMEGMNFEADSNDRKLIAAVVDLLDDMAMDITDLSDEMVNLSEYVEELDDDLGELEEVIYDDEDDYDDDDEYDDDDDDDFIEVECPKCGEEVYFDESIDPEHIKCPACGEEFSVVVEDGDCENCPGCGE